MRYDWSGGIAAPLDAYLHVPAFELKLGDIFFDQEIDKLFQLFLIHECIRLSSVPSPAVAACGGFTMELKRNQVLGGRRQDLMPCFGNQDHIFDSDSTLI